MCTAMKYCKKIAKYNHLEPMNTKDIIGIRPIYTSVVLWVNLDKYVMNK